MPNKGKLIAFAAPSGSGKTTIVKHLLEKHPEFVFSVSATTRNKREHETDGVHYFFISEEEFKRNIKLGNFVEWERFYDYYYGTLKSYVDENLEKGKTLIFDIDVKGAVALKKQYPEANLVFVKPPSVDELKKRLINRNTETQEDLKKRLERVEFELTFENQFDFVVVNDLLEHAFEEAERIIEDI